MASGGRGGEITVTPSRRLRALERKQRQNQRHLSGLTVFVADLLAVLLDLAAGIRALGRAPRKRSKHGATRRAPAHRSKAN